MTPVASFEFSEYSPTLAASPDGEAIFLHLFPLGDHEKGKVLALRSADLSVITELPLAPVFERLQLPASSAVSFEPRGRWMAVASPHKLCLTGLLDRPGEDLVTRPVRESSIYQVIWVPGGGRSDHLCAFSAVGKAVHFEPGDGLDSLRTNAWSLLASHDTLVVYSGKVFMAYDLHTREQRYRLPRPAYGIITVLPDGRALVIAGKPSGGHTELVALNHDGSPDTPFVLPATGVFRGEVSSNGVLAVTGGPSGLLLVRLSDHHCVEVPYGHSIHQLAWVDGDRLAILRHGSFTPGYLRPSAVDVIDTTNLLETLAPPVPPKEKKKRVRKKRAG